MKKSILFFVLCFIFLAGCAQNGSSTDASKVTKNSAGDLEQPQSQSQTQSQPQPHPQTQSQTQPQTQEENFSLPEYDSSGTYYKLEIAPAVIDETAILKYLIPGFDESKVQQDDNIEGTDYSIVLDGIKHTWILGEEGFWYIKESAPDKEVTEAEALAKSDEFIKQNGFEVADDPFVQEWEDNEYAIVYTFQYEGVPVLGDDFIDLKNGDDDVFAAGECIRVTVDGNGIKNVYLSHLFECTNVLEEYQGDKDFLDRGEINSIISKYLKAKEENWEDTGEYEFNAQAKEIGLLYIPYEENGKRILMPVFQVNGVMSIINLEDEESVESKENGESEENEEIMMIDAVTGRIIR